jgi:hypothetical protein
MDNPYGITATGPGVLSVLPLDSSTFVAATPLGALNPPGHVLPTDHVYLYFVDPWGGQQQLNDCSARPVRAAGSGVVNFILRTETGGDTKVQVQMTRTFHYYYDHVLLAPGIAVGTHVNAGDIIGTTTGRCPSIDLGVIDYEVTAPGLVNAARYGSTAHAASPYRYFTAPLQAFIYARVRIYEGVPYDKDGRIGFGVAGRLAGDWFHASLATSGSQDIMGPTGWPRSVSFANDWFDGTPRISIGGLIATPGVLKPAAGSPDARTVSVASGLVVFDVAAVYNGRIGNGWVLAQMLSDARLRIEFVPMPATGAGVRPTQFTSAAQEYVR